MKTFIILCRSFLDKEPQQISQSVLVISIDTAIDASMNVHDTRLWDFLIDAARKGADSGSPARPTV